MAGAEPVPGATVAASVVSTIPATMATKKAYACSTPRIKGLPRSAGRGRVGVIVTMPRLRHRRLLISSKSYFSPVRVHVVGWSALLIEVDDVEGWRVELDRRRAAGELAATEIVPGERTVLLDGVPDPESVAAAVRGWTPAPGAAAGPWPAEVVRRHTATEFRVAFCGFAPGFGYLTGLPEELAVPRLDTPRARVPAGSVGLAGRYCGVYPSPSPGGWLLIGRTSVRLFDVDEDPPALLAPGTRVRFVRA